MCLGILQNLRVRTCVHDFCFVFFILDYLWPPLLEYLLLSSWPCYFWHTQTSALASLPLYGGSVVSSWYKRWSMQLLSLQLHLQRACTLSTLSVVVPRYVVCARTKLKVLSLGDDVHVTWGVPREWRVCCWPTYTHTGMQLSLYLDHPVMFVTVT